MTLNASVMIYIWHCIFTCHLAINRPLFQHYISLQDILDQFCMAKQQCSCANYSQSLPVCMQALLLWQSMRCITSTCFQKALGHWQGWLFTFMMKYTNNTTVHDNQQSLLIIWLYNCNKCCCTIVPNQTLLAFVVALAHTHQYSQPIMK